MMQLNRTEATVLDKAVAVKHEVKKAVLGKDNVINKILTAIIAGGHILLDDIPGVGKTTIALAFSCQIMEEMKPDAFDYKPNIIITEDYVYDK